MAETPDNFMIHYPGEDIRGVENALVEALVPLGYHWLFSNKKVGVWNIAFSMEKNDE